MWKRDGWFRMMSLSASSGSAWPKRIAQTDIFLTACRGRSVDDETIVERMSGRRTCTNCSRTYHIINNPPKEEGKCDFCGADLGIRKDDMPETVKARLETYHRDTEPLKAFYAERGKLLKVENQPSIEATTAEIRKSLGI